MTAVAAASAPPPPPAASLKCSVRPRNGSGTRGFRSASNLNFRVGGGFARVRQTGYTFLVQEMAAIPENFAVARSGQNLLKKSLKSFNKNFKTIFF